MPAQTRYFPFGGGLDISTPAISVPPGRLISCLNFEPDIEGGYRFAPGYERYDGSPRPHLQTFIGFDVKPYTENARPLVVTPPPGYLDDEWDGPPRTQERLLDIRDSGGVRRAVAHLAGFVNSDEEGTPVEALKPQATEEQRNAALYAVGVFRVTGQLEIGYVINGEWEIASEPITTQAPTQRVELDWLRTVRDAHRRTIQRVPGAGPVRGVWHAGEGRTYAWRDDRQGQFTVPFQATIVADRETRVVEAPYTAGSFRAFSATGPKTNQEGDDVFLRRIRRFVFDQGDLAGVFDGIYPGDLIRATATGLAADFRVEAEPTLSGSQWTVEVGVVHIGDDTSASTSKEWRFGFETSLFDTPGWKKVPDGRITWSLKFKEGARAFAEGQAIAAGGLRATVRRVVDWSGGYSTGDATGYLVLTVTTSGDTAADADIQVGGATHAKATGPAVPARFPAGERMRIDQYNFFASPRTSRVYGCCGGRAFELDEDGYISEILVPSIRDLTGLADRSDEGYGKIINVAAHGDHLFLAAEGGRLAASATGLPSNFSGTAGASEYGIGSEITGLESVAGAALVIASERYVQGLFGTTPADFRLRGVSEKQGIAEDSVRKVDDVYGLGWSGVAGTTRTDQFGDFNSDTVSNAVQPLLDGLREHFTCASIAKSRNLYRLHYGGRRPHYEFGQFRRAADANSVAVTLSDNALWFEPVMEGSPPQDTGDRTVVMARDLAVAQWLESAAGADTWEGTMTLNATAGASNFNIVAATGLAVVGSAADAPLRRSDREDADFRNATIKVVGGGAEIGTFTVNARGPGTTFSGLWTGGTLTAGTAYAIEIRVPPKDPTLGEGGSFFIRQRGVEHFYDVKTYRTEGVAANGADGATCRLTLARARPARDDFLDGRQLLGEIEAGLKSLADTNTESIVMYVPESNSPSNARGVATREGVEFGRTVVPVAIDAMWECATPLGERVFFSGADGIVYEDRVGTSHDGASITGFIRLPFLHAGSPSTRKRFRQVDLEMGSYLSLRLRVVMDLDYFGDRTPSLIRSDEELVGQGAFWDSNDTWDAFDWDGVTVNHAKVDLVGTGINASFLLVFEGDHIDNLVMQGMTLHYSPRRLERG